MRRALLWRLPILLGMLMIAGPALLVYMNAFHRLVAGVPMYSDTALHGVQPPVAQPRLTRESVLSGTFEHAYGTYFGRRFPLLAEAVRTKGQLYWSVLHQSPTWFISVGRHDVLYENAYLDEYCSRDIAAYGPVARNWAVKLRRMQDWYAAHGKVFLYLLTPSKAATEPETMPPRWLCRASLPERDGFHAAYLAILDRAGVRVVDAVATTTDARHRYPFPAFPPGGTHFNDVMAALAVRQMIGVMTQAGGQRRVDDFTFSWVMSKPDEVDTDLLDALNVPYANMRYETPTITMHQIKHRACKPLMMAQVGGSFTYQIDKVFDLLGCPPKIDLYEYYRNVMAFYPGGLRYKVDPARREWMLLDAADVVVLEENEELAARSQHGEAFYDLVSTRIQADRAKVPPPAATPAR